jgi:polysaccharide biosynthesis protein PslA
MQNFSDRLVGILLLIATLPTIALIALAVRVSSGRPIFCRSARIDQNGRAYEAWVFRVKRLGSPTDMTSAPRFTAIGSFLWSARLDELPIVISLAKGTARLGPSRASDPGSGSAFGLTILAPH